MACPGIGGEGEERTIQAFALSPVGRILGIKFDIFIGNFGSNYSVLNSIICVIYYIGMISDIHVSFI